MSSIRRDEVVASWTAPAYSTPTIVEGAMASATEYRPEIDGLRTVAVLSVLLYHFGFGIKGGYVGVDVFFVISGFLITGKIIKDLDAERFSFVRFFMGRVRRIYPALLATVAVTFAAGVALMSPSALHILAGEAISAVLSVSNIWFWLDSGYFVPEASSRALLHTWSLGVEEQFYLLWPLTLVLCWKFARRNLLVAVASISACSFVWSIAHLQLDPTGAFFLLPARVFEFGIGAMIALAGKEWRFSDKVSNIITSIGLLLIGITVVVYASDNPFPSYGALAPCMGAALCILGRGNGRVSQITLCNPVSIYLGKISYSLYLVHWPLIVMAMYVLMREFTWPERCLGLGVSILLAHLSYRYVETPFRRRGHLGLEVSTRKLATVVTAFGSILVALGVFTVQTDGWPGRISSERQALLAVGDDGKLLHRQFYGGRSCDIRRCETNPGVEQSVFVIGDSHARALAEGLRSIEGINFVIYGPDACPMFSVDERFEGNSFADACKKAQDAAFQEIAAAHKPTVIITQHWVSRGRAKHDDNDLYPFSSHVDFAKHVSKELDELVAKLGIGHLIVVGGVPRYSAPLSPLDCATRPYEVSDCLWAYRSDEYLQEQESFNSALAPSNATVIDPYDFLCDGSRCKNFTAESLPIYSDRTHLSVWGSKALVEAMGLVSNAADTASSDH